MTDASPATSDMSSMIRMESQLASTVNQAASEIKHIDSLDHEQRSEIYTILEVIRADTDQHCQIVGQWVSERSDGAVHA